MRTLALTPHAADTWKRYNGLDRMVVFGMLTLALTPHPADPLSVRMGSSE